MRTPIATLVAAVLALHPAAGAADEAVRFFVDGDVAKPTGPSVFADMWKLGYGVGVGAEYAVIPGVGIWGRGAYTRHAMDPSSANGRVYTQGPLTGVSGGGLSIWTLQVGARLRAPRGTVRPYLDLGAMFGTMKIDDLEIRYQYWMTGEPMSYVARGTTESKPGFTVGFGLLYEPRPSLGLFLDAHVEVLLTEGDLTHYVPVRVGVLFP